jgi:hypothetical protein
MLFYFIVNSTKFSYVLENGQKNSYNKLEGKKIMASVVAFEFSHFVSLNFPCLWVLNLKQYSFFFASPLGVSIVIPYVGESTPILHPHTCIFQDFF